MRSIGIQIVGLGIVAMVFVVGVAGWLVRKAEAVVLGCVLLLCAGEARADTPVGYKPLCPPTCQHHSSGECAMNPPGTTVLIKCPLERQADLCQALDQNGEIEPCSWQATAIEELADKEQCQRDGGKVLRQRPDEYCSSTAPGVCEAARRTWRCYWGWQKTSRQELHKTVDGYFRQAALEAVWSLRDVVQLRVWQ